jgi:peptidoglycan/LPS O-acetylase OafA/YrhL
MNLLIFFGPAMIACGGIAVAAIISRTSAFYRTELAADVGRRELSLDGLRGLAALMVVVHHGALFRGWLLTGTWGEAGVDASWIMALGPAGVHLFFMLTGFLFWSKARAGNGKVRIWKLWHGRLYRIAPLYLFAVAAVFVVVVVIRGTNILTLKNWNAFWRLFAFGIFRRPPLSDGYNPAEINAYVIWTLWFEWRFYFVLPFIAWFAVRRRSFWLAAAVGAGVFVMHFFVSDVRLQMLLTFILGMLCPNVMESRKFTQWLRSQTAAGVALAVTVLLAVLNRGPFLAFYFAVALFPIFLAAAAGNNFWGILTARTTRCLGAFSYSLYLLHGTLFFIVMSLLKSAHLLNLPALWYWVILMFTAMAATALSSATFRFIEFPFLTKSHKTAAKMLPLVPEPVTQSSP